ncbi:HlyD family efflux transporter periplasmic adaptor subunit [Cardinium endosymbiont of Nabis limbatus]|uniref:HlyD family efflux transporter periplasmic adaptor subunit n=1 Tax=Cardinium endosymbiont of Nabis limbatus TaxID=3066217 RepID=UPI003AF3B07C
MEHSKLTLRSIVIQEILGYIPHWMIRWGMMVIAALLAMLLFITWLIQYPDIIEGKGYLTSTIPPITVHTAQNGTIGRIYVPDNTIVAAHTPLAEIKNALSEAAIVHLKRWLTMVEKDLRKHYFPSERYCPTHHSYGDGEILGVIQEAYNTLQKYIRQYITSFQNDYHLSSCKHIKAQIQSTHVLLHITKLQLTYSQRKMTQEKIKFRACKQLYQRKMISQVDFFKQESLLLHAKEDVANKQKTIVEYQITLNNYQKQLKELTFKYQQDRALLESAIYASLQNLQKEVMDWQQHYLLMAPFSGNVCYLDRWYEGQQIKAGQAIFSVVPANESYLVQVQLPSVGYGKIQKGQLARIKFAAYPDQEYGYLAGVVNEVALVPHRSTYRVTLLLTNGLTTNYGKLIDFKPSMKCEAEIVTKAIRLLTRMIYRLLTIR